MQVFLGVLRWDPATRRLERSRETLRYDCDFETDYADVFRPALIKVFGAARLKEEAQRIMCFLSQQEQAGTVEVFRRKSQEDHFEFLDKWFANDLDARAYPADAQWILSIAPCPKAWSPPKLSSVPKSNEKRRRALLLVAFEFLFFSTAKLEI